MKWPGGSASRYVRPLTQTVELGVDTLASLEVWRVGREVARATYRLTLRCPLERHYALTDLIRRAAISIPASVAEGYAVGTPELRVQCLRAALAAASALKCHLEPSRDLRLLDDRSTQPVMKGCDRLVSLLVGMTRRAINANGRAFRT